MRKNSTFGFLIVLILGFLIGTVANIYFVFNPSGYDPTEFNLYSLWDWSIILLQVLVVINLLFITQKAKDKYVKIFWLFLSIVCLLGTAPGYLIRDKSVSQMISAIESSIISLVLLIFLFLYQKHKFDLFEEFKKDYGASAKVGRLIIIVLLGAILGLAAWMFF